MKGEVVEIDSSAIALEKSMKNNFPQSIPNPHPHSQGFRPEFTMPVSLKKYKAEIFI